MRVPQVWLVDPLEHLLEVLRLEGDRYSILSVHQHAESVRAEPFDAIALDLSLIHISEPTRPY